MQILQINKFHFVKGGADKYYLELSAMLHARGHKVAHFSMNHESNQPSLDTCYFISCVDFEYRPSSIFMHPLNTLKVISRIFWSVDAQQKLKKLIQAFSPDIAHVHNLYHQISPSILNTLGHYKIPIVMTVHDRHMISCNYGRYHHGRVCSHTPYRSFWRAIPNKCVKNSYFASALEVGAHYVHKLTKMYERQVDYFIFPSKFLAQEHLNADFRMKKFEVISNYVEYKKHNTKENTHKPSSETYALYVGRLDDGKGVEFLIRSFSIFSKKINKQLQLLIAGDGPLKEQLQSLITSLQMDHYIKLLGYKSKNSLTRLSQRALFLVFPSFVLENCPLALLEAMSHGLPVIASKVGGIPEIITHGENGLLFNRGNAEELVYNMKKIFFNPSLAYFLGEQARQDMIEQYNEQVHYDKLLTIYKDLVYK